MSFNKKKFNSFIFVIGIDHCLQFGGCNRFNQGQFNNYREILKSCLEKNNISVVAEEASYDQSGRLNSRCAKCGELSMTIAQKIIKENKGSYPGLRSHFIDPDESQRRTLGIPSRDDIAKEMGFSYPYSHLQEDLINKVAIPYDDKREQYWINKLLNFSKRNILLIIGWKHLDSLIKKFRISGFEYQIIGKLN